MAYRNNSFVDIPWEMLDTVISGQSGIDVPQLYVRSLDDAENFLSCYGYEWHSERDRKAMDDIRQEALAFLLDELLYDEEHLVLHEEVREQADPRRLLLWASDTRRGERQFWACTLLKVMHTFSHCNSYFRDQFDQQIRDQIFNRIRAHLHQSDDGLSLGKGPSAIPLWDLELKGGKTRASTAMKLLQKPEHIKADIFDWVGVRFVTHERFDALLVAKYLRVNNLIMFAHVHPGRSRNTLIDIERIKADMARLDEEIRAGRLAYYERWNKMRELVRDYPYPEPAIRSYNPYSAIAYHSLQFTCSQWIRVSNPYIGGAAERLMRMREQSPKRSDLFERALDRIGVHPEIRFQFPFEVQILDRRSFEQSRSGLASHEVYKERQRQAVKERLFGRRLTSA